MLVPDELLGVRDLSRPCAEARCRGSGVVAAGNKLTSINLSSVSSALAAGVDLVTHLILQRDHDAFPLRTKRSSPTTSGVTISRSWRRPI